MPLKQSINKGFLIRDALILLAEFLENMMVKAKSKMLEKWVKLWKIIDERLDLSVNCMAKIEILYKRTVKDSTYAPWKSTKRSRYFNRAITMV